MPDTQEQNTEIQEHLLTQIAQAEQGQPTDQNIDYRILYQQERQRNADLEAVISSARMQPPQPVPGADVKVKTFEQARAQCGETRWNHKMTHAQRLVALGQDPNQDVGYLRQVWGKGADPRLSQDLFKANPFKYRATKEAAKALNIYCN